ncbi:hypothetical protein, partial [Parvimonas sp. D9]
IRTYTKKEVYYSYIPTNGLIALPAEPTELIRLFGKDAIAMNNYLLAHKLKTKKETDLIKLFAHYNALKKSN